MDKDLKEKWLFALRSGKYNQGRGTLYNALGHTYCCLGVLCQIGGLSIKFDIAEYNGDTSCTNLPISYANAIGITENDERQLVEMNDKERKSFVEIADWIEENL